jgi:hypothetical protein
MSSQNWSENFPTLFQESRGYDPMKFVPAIFGYIVEDVETTERFLWDLRRVGQELVYDNNVHKMKELGAERGLAFSTEAYDLNPAGDLWLFRAADVPMCEFWSDGYGFDSRFSVFEAVSSAHTTGKAIVASESFTSAGDKWRQHPGAAKRQGDWAFCAGVNRFFFHRMCSQPNDDAPGLSLGPHGMHFDRTQTWFPLLGGKGGYTEYLSRVQSVLQRGAPCADVLALDQEKAPCVFVPPRDAFMPTPWLDKDRWNLDGCCPQVLIDSAEARDGKIFFPGGACYSLLVLPQTNEMTPELARKLLELKDAGVPILGAKPVRSPSLVNREESDAELAQLVDAIWSGENAAVTPRYKPQFGADPALEALTRAEWLWSGEWVNAAPGATVTFVKTVVAPENPSDAWVAIAADNASELRVNGQVVGSGGDFRTPKALEITQRLISGENEIAITVVNEGDAPNPAGLIATISIDGVETRTDASWRALDLDGKTLETAALGPYDMSPWNMRYERTFDRDSTYPVWSDAIERLGELGIAPDFVSVVRHGAEISTSDVRWLHRRDGETDVYFVANTTEEELEARCFFRVVDKSAQLWDPITGARYALDAAPATLPPSSDQQSASAAPEHLAITLRFVPAQSWFVVFTPDVDATAALPKASELFAPVDRSVLLDLSSGWNVTFDQNASSNRDFPEGRPKTVSFDTLEDWSQSRDDYLRYYSGIAVYHKSFDSLELKPGSALFLEFEDVQVMAKVELNGQELATLWTKPWRVAVPPELLKPRDNHLTVTVANLWCNRLIGDASRAEDERFTRSSNPMWGPGDEQLQRSGIIGTARIVEETPVKEMETR